MLKIFKGVDSVRLEKIKIIFQFVLMLVATKGVNIELLMDTTKE